MLDIKEYVDIKEYSTLKVGGQFRYFVIISSINDLNYIYNIIQNDLKYKDIPLFILGGGSNVVFSDGVINVLALKIEIKGFEVINKKDNYVDIKVGAGEVWDEIVVKTVEMNLSGLESLSAIPGMVGAGPVQNIGAYGSEVKDSIVEVEVYDIENNIIKNISNKDCKFGYRDSIFKREAKGKYIILGVTYRLLEVQPQLSSEVVSLMSVILYPGVSKYFEDKNIKNPTLKQIREAIIDIRSSKLPNPKEIPNVGSFFKNPILTKDQLNLCINQSGMEIPFFNFENDLIKVPTGWLIENAGLKGESFGNVSVYDKNALVLINTNNATCEDIIFARNKIIKIVKDKFGITLEQEPDIIKI